MEEDNDLEQVTGSPTAGENGFVHVESVDSAQTDDASVNQVEEHLEQDDGVVVTGVDTVQDEPLYSARAAEEVGHDEFVDCPDDLIASDARSPIVANRAHQPFRVDTQVIESTVPEIEKEILPQNYEEERRELMNEVSNLHHQLKALSKQQSPTDVNDAGVSSSQLSLETEEGGEKTLLPLREMVNECSKFIEASLNEQSQAENTIREVNAALITKDKEIEDLTVRINEHSTSQDVALKSDEMSFIETTADRILSSFATVLGVSDLSDTSVSGKLSHLEQSTFLLLEKYNYFLYEVGSLSSCLTEINSEVHMQNGMENVFASVREELVALKRKEIEFSEKSSHWEYQHGELMEQVNKEREKVEFLNSEIEKLKVEVEQEKTRYSNSKEKLSMAVTKGKTLVQQRDSLKQSVAEKTSELERCLTELQEKSTLTNSLQEALLQRDMILQKCGEILSLSGALAELQSSDIIEGVTWLANERSRLVPLAFEFHRLTDLLSSLELPENMQFPNLESQVVWLLESYNIAKDQCVKLQNQIHSTMEADRNQIDQLTTSLSSETQEKYYLKEEFQDLTTKYEAIVKEKEQIVALLLDASGISLDDLEDNLNMRSDTNMMINTCFSKIKEQAAASIESTHVDKESFEKIQNLLYVRDQESKLYEQILEDEKIYKVEILKASEELRALKEEKNLLQINLQKSEEKGSLVREKLSLAVKKGKGLVQERETMKQQMAEKNAQIETLTVDLQKQESTLNEFRLKMESDLLRLKEEKDQIEQYLFQSNTMLQQLIDTIDGIILPVDIKEPVEKVHWIATYLSEFQVAKQQVEQQLEYLKDEAGTLTKKLTEALTTMKSLEDALSVSEKNVSQLSQEKQELEALKTQAEQEVEALNEEIVTLNKKLIESLKSLKSLEDALNGSEKTVSQLSEEKGELEIAKSLAENNVSILMNEKASSEMEIQKVKEEVSTHATNLHEAQKTIKSLKDAISNLNSNVSQVSQQNEKALDGTIALESEMKKLKEEVEYYETTVSALIGEKKNAEQEISALNSELNACKQELSGFFGNLQVLLKDESLSSLFKQSFEKKIESLKEIDRVLKDVKNNFDSEQLQDYPAVEDILQSSFLSAGFDNDWNFGTINDTFNAENTNNIVSYAGKTLDNFNTKNQILTDQFGSFSTLIDNIISSLLKKLDSIKNTMPSVVQQTKALQHNTKNLQMDKQIQDNKVATLEHGIKLLISACADVTKELKFHSENNTLNSVFTLGVEKPNPSPLFSDQEEITDVKAAADELFIVSRNVQSLIEQYVSVKDNMSTTIEELQNELEKTRLIYDKSQEENDALQSRVFELESELEASGNMCNEMSSKLEDYRAKEEKWELSTQSTSSAKVNEVEAEKALLSASEIKSLFDKVNRITIPFPNLVMGEIQPHDSDPVKNLFYIVDSVNELLDQLTLLRSTLSKQTLEVNQLKNEFQELTKNKEIDLSLGLQNIIQKLGGDEAIGVKKSADVAGMVAVLETLVQGVVLDNENSRFKSQDLGFKLVETQKVAEELASKVKLLEDIIQNRTGGGPDTKQERSIFEAPSLPAGSEISEIEEQVPVVKAGLPLVPSAAHVRSLRKGSNEQLAVNRKGSNDQLAINIDSESDRLLDKSQTVEDKGHLFKSLHTSGLVPVKGKMIADRLDGIWVSGGQALMRRPRARLGLIAYWLVLHLWILGTIL